jgi:hypothetical protein
MSDWMNWIRNNHRIKLTFEWRIEMKTFKLYQGEKELLSHDATDHGTAANYFRDYLIKELGKTGLYGCRIELVSPETYQESL